MARFSNAGVKVGDVFVDSWGWEQTNIDFYQVVGLRGKSSVELRPIHSLYRQNGFMSALVRPDVGNFKADGRYKTRLASHGEHSIVRRVHAYGDSVWAGSEYLRLCDPSKEHQETSYA